MFPTGRVQGLLEQLVAQIKIEVAARIGKEYSIATEIISIPAQKKGLEKANFVNTYSHGNAQYHLLNYVGIAQWQDDYGLGMGVNLKKIAGVVVDFLTTISETQENLFVIAETSKVGADIHETIYFWLAHRVCKGKEKRDYTIKYACEVKIARDVMGIPKGTVLYPIFCPEAQSQKVPELASAVWVLYPNNPIYGNEPVMLAEGEYNFMNI